MNKNKRDRTAQDNSLIINTLGNTKFFKDRNMNPNDYQ